MPSRLLFFQFPTKWVSLCLDVCKRMRYVHLKQPHIVCLRSAGETGQEFDSKVPVNIHELARGSRSRGKKYSPRKGSWNTIAIDRVLNARWSC